MEKEFFPEDSVAWKLRDVLHRHMQELHNVLAEHKLHFGQPRILYVVSQMDGATQNEIAKKLKISPASLVVSINRMAKFGLVERQADENDSRKKRVGLTQKGKELLEKSFYEMKKIDEQMIEGLTGEEIKSLSNLLDKLSNNLKKKQRKFGGVRC